MTTWLLQGDLGSGKTLIAVSKIQEYLLQNRPVATNLNINIDKMLPPNAKFSRLTRLEDFPSPQQLWSLGEGNDTFKQKIFDKNRNGLLVLDELAGFLNAREFKDKSRNDTIKFLIHTRKLGWDVIYIAQDIEMIDRQIRRALVEHKVLCRASDKLKIPFLTSLLKFTRIHSFVPVFHLGFVRYGITDRSQLIETWKVLGSKTLFNSYDTLQKFSDGEAILDARGQEVIVPYQGMHSVLPPWYTKGRYMITLPKWFQRLFYGLLLSIFIYIAYIVFQGLQSTPEPNQSTTESTPQTLKELETQNLNQETITPSITKAIGLIYKNGHSYAITNTGLSNQLRSYRNENETTIYTDIHANQYSISNRRSNTNSTTKTSN